MAASRRGASQPGPTAPPSSQNNAINAFSGSSHTLFINSSFTIQQNNQTTPTRDGFKSLVSASAPSAFYNSGDQVDPPKCHPNTRVAILERIKDWIFGRILMEAWLMWLYGAAGAGKSAIGRTIAEWCEEQGILVGHFFFSRSDPSRNHSRSFVATLAYCVALAVPSARPSIEQVVEEDPHIFTRSPSIQLTKLVLEPLERCSPVERRSLPYVIIIDGLDECLELPQQKEILALLSILHTSNLQWQVFLGSRPEPIISYFFDNPSIRETSTRIALSDSLDSDSDIRQFLTDKFAALRNSTPNLPQIWPTADMVDQLVQKSSGQFIYAATVYKFLDSSRHPHQVVFRLDVILGLRQLPSYGGGLPFAELDALYTYIFMSIEDLQLAAHCAAICIIQPIQLLDTETCIQGVEGTLSIARDDLLMLLGDLASLLKTDVESGDVTPYHASLGDFLFDPSRAGPCWVDRAAVHTDIAVAFIKTLSKVEIHNITSQGDVKDWWSRFCDILHGASRTEDLVAHLMEIDLSQHWSKASYTANDGSELDQLAAVPFFSALEDLGLKKHRVYGYHVASFDFWLANILEELPLDLKTSTEDIAYAEFLALIIMLEKSASCSEIACIMWWGNPDSDSNPWEDFETWELVLLVITFVVNSDLPHTRKVLTKDSAKTTAFLYCVRSLRHRSDEEIPPGAEDWVFAVLRALPPLLNCAAPSEALITALTGGTAMWSNTLVDFKQSHPEQSAELDVMVHNAETAIQAYVERVTAPSIAGSLWWTVLYRGIESLCCCRVEEGGGILLD